MEPSLSLVTGFVTAAERFPTRPAIDAGGEVSYGEMLYRAKCLAETIQREHSAPGGPPLSAVFAYRSQTAFAGILGTLLAGHGYVPLNRTFPVERTRLMLERSQCQVVIVDATSEPQLETILPGLNACLALILPERADVSEWRSRFPNHRIFGANDLCAGEGVRTMAPEDIAYLLFTSGSTGQPKGVMVSHRNVRHYVDYVSRRYAFTSQDRLSQTFDMTFDLSAHDMFVGWQNGACVCCPTAKQLIKPGAFINDARLSVWFSVPSTAVFMRRFGVLKAGMYPGLRLSLFCGEALPVEVVQQWRQAAPNSIIENIYGPTELTIACTAYRWDQEKSPAEAEQGVVPIGGPFDGMRALVVDEELCVVPEGADGELVMTGPQLTLGYWQDEAKTQKAFVRLPGEKETFYRTGDRVRKLNGGGPLLYLGRLDSQVKILGHRVELGEIEAVAREESEIDGAVALGWPINAGGADGIELFLQADEREAAPLLDQLRKRLPTYMVPRRVHFLPHFPLNSNGKYDRGALLKILKEES